MKKIIWIIAAAALLAAAVWLVPVIKDKTNEEQVLTSAELEKAINIAELSTAEFIYNGVAVKPDEEDPEEAECHIAYHASVKVGIDIKEVHFTIDQEQKTVTPVLPEIQIHIAELDEDEISYIPKNPDLPLEEVIALCKEDAIEEANHSKQLYQAAEENLKAVIEALVDPLLDSAGYTIAW